MSAADWGDLARRLRGRVHLPGDPLHAARSAPFNTRYDHVRPAAVASVADVDDVRAAILWAREHDTPLVARSGGHSYGGHSVGPGLVLDLGALCDVRADASTGLLVAGGGALMSHVHAALEPHDIAFALGNSPTVGIAGLALGGGVAAASRALGLTSDALVETVVVTASGDVLRCDENTNADLFWACRGAGGGNFGVHVSLTFQAEPVRDAATCLLLWDWADAERVLPVLQAIVRDAPDAFSARLGLGVAGGDARGRRVVSAVGQHLGSAAELREIIAPALAVATPARTEIDDRTFWEARDYLRHETTADRYAVRTNFSTGVVPDQAVAAMLRLLEKWPGSGNADGANVGMFAWGGRINRVAADATAFAHRDALFLVALDTSWSASDDPGLVEANLRWLDELYEATGAHLTGHAYQNFIDPALVHWQHAYHGANYPRLREVKRRHDPDQVFTFEQAIEPAST